MTAILVSNSGDVHCDYLVDACSRLNVSCFRINTDRFRISGAIDWKLAGQRCTLSSGKHECDLADVNLVVYRRPVIAHELRAGIEPWVGRLLDAEWAALEGALSVAVRGRVLNGLAGSALAQNKVIQIQMATRCHLNVPDTLISTDAESLRQFARKLPCVTKGIVNAFHIDGDRLRSALTSRVSITDLDSYDGTGKPTLLQRAIEPNAVWRIVVIGTKTIGFRFYGPELASETDSRKVEDELKGDAQPVPDTVASPLVAMCEALGIEFASSDFIEDASGQLWFVDLNPEGQWAFLEDRFGVRISDEIIRLALDA